MPWALHSLLFLSISPSLALARGHAIRGRNAPVYGDNTFRQVATTTVTVTDLRTVTVGQSSCEVVYIPTTVTVFTASPDGRSTVSAGPIRSDTSRGPWANATSGSNTPCSHGLPSSTRFVTATSPRPLPSAPGNVSTSAGWNRTTVVPRPTLSGTAGTTVEGADPIGTSSLLWTNSSRPSATAESSGGGFPFPLTSSTVFPVSAGVTAPSGGYGGPDPSSGYGTGTAAPGDSSIGGLSPYQPSLTYQTTLPGPFTSATRVNGTATSPSTSPTFSFSLPPGWSISTIRHTTSSTTTPSLSSTTILTTESNDPIFTTTTRAHNSSSSFLPPPSSSSTLLSPSPSASSSTETPDDYGSYTYPIPSASSSSWDEYPTPSSFSDEYPAPSSSSAEYPPPSSSAAEYPISSSPAQYPTPSSSSSADYPTPSTTSASDFTTDSADAIGGTHSTSATSSLDSTPSSAPEATPSSAPEETATATATATATVTVTSFETEPGTSTAAASSTSTAADDMYDEGGESGELYGGEYGGDEGYGGYQY
ncbi:hypothetical protein C8A05DRAFT_29760 [Staphylotrichum tortipilum]|uniref:Uncharacterized protein n=1 Tax=Staphylotrichum tortipilum TaxID=2831512 RepID=A0AAN6MSN9_9PEZI|nr:hypothetical protein C8A05DRAFT_29760 [Staphylotrichum longicolle]